MIFSEEHFLTFADWFKLNLSAGVITACIVVFLIFVAGYLISAIRHGPIRGFDVVSGVTFGLFQDILSLSPRRLYGLTKLVVLESLRRWVWIGLALFLLIILFVNWYLDPGSPHPIRLYVSWLMGSARFLLAGLSAVLCVFSLPNEFKSKTMFTLATKPVHSSEIVLSRILGITLVCTLQLIVMGVVTWAFLQRSLGHAHEVDVASLSERGALDGKADTLSFEGFTSSTLNHRHALRGYGDGLVEIENENDHSHTATKSGEAYVVSGPQDMLIARKPVHGNLRFYDRTGQAKTEGLNVGDEFEYRSYIEGGTRSSAIWTFTNLTSADFPGDYLFMDLTLGVFRTHKGDIEQTVLGQIVLKNPETNVASVPIRFNVKEFRTLTLAVPRKIAVGTQEVDLFADLVSNGKLEVELKCLDLQQYFGMARGDLYLKGPNSNFTFNLFKGFFGIWLQLFLITSLGVMFSTIVNSPVTLLAIIGCLVGGLATPFMQEIMSGGAVGGGPFESFVRTLENRSIGVELDPGATQRVVTSLDRVTSQVFSILQVFMPNLEGYETSHFVAYGYNIPENLVAIHLVKGLMYFALTFLLGHLFLKTREVAK